MNDRLDPKICYFCSNPSQKKLILNPATKILNEVFLSAYYDGNRYPVCTACGVNWDNRLNEINVEYKKNIDKLFETLVVKKGALIESGEDKPSEQIHSSDKKQDA